LFSSAFLPPAAAVFLLGFTELLAKIQRLNSSMVDIYLSSRAEVASVILMMTLCPETGEDDRGGDEPG